MRCLKFPYFHSAELKIISSKKELTLKKSKNNVRSSYRFGFNGMLKDNELKGIGNSLDFGARMYDSRIGRWFTMDPKFKLQPCQSTYKSFLNNPIIFNDPEGETEFYYKGNWIGTDGKQNNLISVVSKNKVRRAIISQTKLGINQPEMSTTRGAEKRKNMFLINKDVLQTSYEILGLSLSEKGKVGEYSVSMNKLKDKFLTNGDIEYNKGENTKPIPKGDVSIHSHPTGIEKGGQYGRADQPSNGINKDIPGLFKNFDINIIVGKSGEVERDGDNYNDKRTEDINIYERNTESNAEKTEKIGSLKKEESRKILTGERGRLGEIYDKKK